MSRLSSVGLALLGVLLFEGAPAQADPLRADGLPVKSPERPQRDADHAEHGRMLFNGKGICFYCHGVDGEVNRLPQLTKETQELIANLKPKPANLRDNKALTVRTDQARVRVIREGHPGTGMFPDTTLTDDEIKDLLAYLDMLRRVSTTTKVKP
jgi:mono/diheme cytochrome c family protein